MLGLEWLVVEPCPKLRTRLPPSVAIPQQRSHGGEGASEAHGRQLASKVPDHGVLPPWKTRCLVLEPPFRPKTGEEAREKFERSAMHLELLLCYSRCCHLLVSLLKDL